MPSIYNRFVAVLLVLSQFVDPALAVSFGGTRGFSPFPSFAEQALAPMAELMHRLPLAEAFKGRHVINESVRRPGEFSRRGFLALFAAPLAAQSARQPGDAQSEKVRQDLLKLFRDRDNFRAEIDAMFDRSLVADDAAATRAQVHDAMVRFLRFIEQATIIPTNDMSYTMYIEVEKNQFAYNPAYWEDLLHVSFDQIFHEAVHFSEQQQAWHRDRQDAIAEVQRIAPRYESATRLEMRSNEPFRHAARTLVASSWKCENQAWYLQMAFNAVMAHGLTVEAYLEQRRQRAPWDPIIASAIVVAGTYDPAHVSRKFMYAHFYNYIALGLSMESILTRLLAPDQTVESLLVRAASGGKFTYDENVRLMDWSYEEFLAPPSGWLGGPALPLTLVTGALGGLAFWRFRRRAQRPVSRQAARAEARRGSRKKDTSHGPGTPAADQPTDMNLGAWLGYVESAMVELQKGTVDADKDFHWKILQERVTGLADYLTTSAQRQEVEQHAARIERISESLYRLSPKLGNLMPPTAAAWADPDSEIDTELRSIARTAMAQVLDFYRLALEEFETQGLTAIQESVLAIVAYSSQPASPAVQYMVSDMANTLHAIVFQMRSSVITSDRVLSALRETHEQIQRAMIGLAHWPAHLPLPITTMEQLDWEALARAA